jgi:hypothetical protein
MRCLASLWGRRQVADGEQVGELFLLAGLQMALASSALVASADLSSPHETRLIGRSPSCWATSSSVPKASEESSRRLMDGRSCSVRG